VSIQSKRLLYFWAFHIPNARTAKGVLGGGVGTVTEIPRSWRTRHGDDRLLSPRNRW